MLPRTLPSLAVAIAFLLPLGARAADDAAIEPDQAGPDFAVQGEYVGPKDGAQVIALGDGKFRLIHWLKGLPGTVEDAVKEPEEVEGAREGDKVVFRLGKSTATIDASGVLTTGEGSQAVTLKHVLRESPTLGAKPPEGATVLFDGTNTDAWAGGKMDDRKFLACGTKTKQEFGDCTLHIEFRTPFKASARGQGRGNSGVYMQDRFECQVLDSFGLKGEDNEAGGIYHTSKPKLNMCFPPLSWQTYDIDFEAAKYEGDKKVKPAVLTVKLNGVLVQDHIEAPVETPGAGRKDGPGPGPIQLQNHGNPVFYKNIWIVEKK